MNLLERIEIAKQTDSKTNCGGTAFFITDVLPEDKEVDIVPCLDYHKITNPPPLNYLSELDQIDEPEDGCLILFRHTVMNNFPQHIGVVVNFEGELKMVARRCPGIGQPIEVDDLSNQLKRADMLGYIIEYYCPKPLYR